MFKYKRNKIVYITIIIFLFIVLPTILLAQTGPPKPVKIENPIAVKSITDFISKILDIVVTIGTPIAVLAIIYSGFLFVKAQGKPEEINRAKETFLYTIIGIVILISATAISTLIQNTVEDIKSGSGEKVSIEQIIDINIS